VDEQNRRELLKLPLAAGALTLAARADAQAQARSAGKQRKTIDEFDSANIKLAHRVSIRASDDDLLFLKQIGLRYIRAEIPLDAKLEELAPARDRFAKAGISIISCALRTSRSTSVARPGPGRDRDIETCQAVVRELTRLGVSILVLDWHPGNVYTSQNVDTPRGYKAREFSVSDFQSKQEKQLFGREYPAEEIWDGFVYWLKAVLPVAEEANVKLAMHPDDPPVLKKMNGIGRIFTNEECYRRAERWPARAVTSARSLRGTGQRAAGWGRAFEKHSRRRGTSL
jgi:mannonate dehydratase